MSQQYGEGQQTMFRRMSPHPPRWSARLRDAADRLDEVRLPHAVNLQVLPHGQPQSPLPSDSQRSRCAQQLLAGKASAGNDRPQHEAVFPLLRRPARLAKPPPLVAVVLLIDAVLPQQRRGVVAEVVVAVRQFLNDPPAEPWLWSLIVSIGLSCGDAEVMAMTIEKRRNLRSRGAMPTLAWACCYVLGDSHAHASVGMAPIAPHAPVYTHSTY